MKPVMSVEHALGHSYVATSGKRLFVSASGKVRTGGWTNPQLDPRIYIDPPADGVWDFDFVAQQPDAPVPECITPISTSRVYDAPDWLKGIRVHAETNAVEAGILSDGLPG